MLCSENAGLRAVRAALFTTPRARSWTKCNEVGCVRAESASLSLGHLTDAGGLIIRVRADLEDTQHAHYYSSIRDRAGACALSSQPAPQKQCLSCCSACHSGGPMRCRVSPYLTLHLSARLQARLQRQGESLAQLLHFVTLSTNVRYRGGSLAPAPDSRIIDAPGTQGLAVRRPQERRLFVHLSP